MPTNSPLIEHYLPIDAISVEAIREGGALAGHPPVNQLHVWWARRPLITSRAAVAASVIEASADKEAFTQALGTSSQIVRDRATMDAMKAKGEWSDIKFSGDRAFKYNPLSSHHDFFQKHSLYAGHTPTVLDVTAGGGSIPFEAGRLGLKTIANELNPVAAFILRATCEWPQRYGYALLNEYLTIASRFQGRVDDLAADVYPPESQPTIEEAQELIKFKFAGKKIPNVARVKRSPRRYLFARVTVCASCNRSIPLSPNWRLDSTGKGMHLLPNTKSGTCDFEIVERIEEQSPGTINRAIPTCPYSDCGASMPKGYVAHEAQSGRLGQVMYAISYRDEIYLEGRRRPVNIDGFRVSTTCDDNSADVDRMLADNAEEWGRKDILPTENRVEGDADRVINYGITHAINLFSPRQRLALALCVQAFRELVDEDRTAGILEDERKITWGYVALAFDKMLSRNNLLARWDAGTNKVASSFDTHDFGIKWSYAEMPVCHTGGGIEWAIGSIYKCLDNIIQMTGHIPTANGQMNMGDNNLSPTASAHAGHQRSCTIHRGLRRRLN